MDQSLLTDLNATARALKASITRSQNGVAGLRNIAKLGPGANAASASILSELKQLEGEMQRLLKSYREILQKATLSASMPGPKDQRDV